jgi:hypothetical protein
MNSNKELVAGMRSLAASIGKNGALVSAEQILDWANAIDPQGFIVTGLSNKAIVRKFSEMGVLEDIMREACALYGLELTLSDTARSTIMWHLSSAGILGYHLGKLVVDAKIPANKFYDYNCTFKLTDEGAEIAMEGLKETHA